MSSPISAFTAVPNPQMLAFMATQSFLMMQMAGAGWQYGKRKISAMKNEEFNALTIQHLLQSETADVRAAIPTIIKSINDMTPMVGEIVAQYGDFVKEIIKATPQLISNIYRPEKSPSVETFNPLSILNPLLPAFADDSVTSSTSSSLQTESQLSNRQRVYINSIKGMSKIQLIAEANRFHTKGFSSDFINNIIRPLWEKLMEQVQHVSKTLPKSTNILKKTRVSKQTLRRQRTLLINTVRVLKTKKRNNDASIKSARDPKTRASFQRNVNGINAKLQNAKQSLSNFLARWKGVKY